MKIQNILFFIILSYLFLPSQHLQAQNSNKWPVFLEQDLCFRISYPPSWEIIPNKGPNVKISISPKDGPGNCNVVVQSVPEIHSYSQSQLNKELDGLPLNIETWASLLNMPSSQFSILEQKRSKANQVSAIYGVIEFQGGTLTGRFFGKKIVAFMLTPGKRWSVTCGVSTYSASEGRTRFDQLQPYLLKILESFTFIDSAKPITQQHDEIQSNSIEDIASQIANNHNKNADQMLDDITLSTSAKAIGKNVIFTNILKAKKGLTKQELEQFRTELYKEIVPPVCHQNSDNSAFKKGLSYTFIYFNKYDEKLYEIKVDSQTCNGY